MKLTMLCVNISELNRIAETKVSHLYEVLDILADNREIDGDGISLRGKMGVGIKFLRCRVVSRWGRLDEELANVNSVEAF